MELLVHAVLARGVPHVHGVHQLVDGHLHERGQLLDGVGRERVAVGHRVDGGVDLGFLGLVLQRVVGHVLAHIGAVSLTLGIVHEPLLVGQGEHLPLAAEVLVAVAVAVVQRQRAFLALREHGGAFPFLVEAAPVDAHHDAERLLEAAVRHGLLAVQADAVRPGAREAVHVPHPGAQLRADAMAVAGVGRGARRVHALERQVVLQHLGVVLEAAAGHDNALARLRVDALVLVLVHRADHGLRLGILHERGQRRAGLARHLIGVLLQNRAQELADVRAVLVGVVFLELAFGERSGILQLEPFGLAVALRRDLDVVFLHAQAAQPFPVLGGALRIRLVDGRRRGGHAAQHGFHVHGERVGLVGDMERPAAHRRVAAADEGGAFLQQQRGKVAALGRHRDGRGQACGARADDDDVVLLVPCDIGDGRGGIVRGILRRLRAAPRQAERRGAQRGHAARLDEVAARERVFLVHVSSLVTVLPGESPVLPAVLDLPAHHTTIHVRATRPGSEQRPGERVARIGRT